MKRIFAILAAATAALGIVSCNKEQPAAKPAADIKVNVKVAAPDGDADTKAVKTAWEDGDKIYVYFNGDITFNAPQLTLTYNGADWEASFGSTFDESKLGASGNFAVFYDKFVDITEFDSNGSLGALYKSRMIHRNGLELYENYLSYTFSDNVINLDINNWTYLTSVQVVVDGIDSDKAGNYALMCNYLYHQTPSLKSGQISYGTGSVDQFMLGYPNADGAAFYFGQPFGSVTDKYKFTLLDITTGETYEWMTEDKKSLRTNRNKLTAIKIDASKFLGELPEGYENLSAEGTANSYIAKPSSKVYFDASVKGNSAEALAGVAGVNLVWQSEKSLVTSLEYIPGRKIITADLGSASGNALIAAYNAEGEVVWSWHLWVTDYEPEKSLFTTEANAAGTVWKFMDRNLGALSNTPEGFDSHGLLYQWGRKDPFAAAVSYTNQNPDTYEYIDGKDGEPVYYDIDNNEVKSFRLKAAKNGSVELAVKNPDVFYLNLKIDTGEIDEYELPIYDQGDWGKPTNDDAWGGVSMAKTINDPCPVGYKVPVNDASGNTPYAWLKFASMTWDTVNYGATQNGQWFPATGTRVYEGGGLDFPDPALGGNPYSGLWIGTKGSASEHSHYGQYMFIINGKRTFKVNKDSRSQGLSLRCVAE